MKKDILIFIGLIFLIAMALMFYRMNNFEKRFNQKDQRDQRFFKKIDEFTQRIEEAIEIIKGTGAAEPIDNSEKTPPALFRVHSEAMGKIEKIYVQVGDEVKKGQILAKIDDSDIQLIYQQQEQNYKSILANLKNSEANFESAEKNLVRQRQLSEKGLVSITLLENAENGYAKSSGEVKSAQSRLENAELQLKRLKLLVAKTEICSPIDGIIVKSNFQENQVVRDTIWGAPVLFEVIPTESKNGQR